MKILIISQLYYPEQFLINEIAPELVKRGNEVTVICGVPNYPKGEVFEGYENGKKSKEKINGVNVIRCRNLPRGKGVFHLLLNYFTYMVLANKETKRLDGKFDIVFLYQLTPITMAFPAIKYAKRNKVKLVCYCLDLAPASGEDIAGKIKPLMSAYRKFSRWAYQSCDWIAVTSRSFVEYLHSVHDISYEKMSYLPQHAPEDLLYADLGKNKCNNIIDFMFAGNVGFGARLDCAIEAVSILKNEGYTFRFNIVGNGSDKQRLMDMVKDKELESYVIFHEQVPMNEMPTLYKKADALYVSLRKGQITVPGKVQAYMATGKPILGSMDGSGNELIKEAKCGECVAAEDVLEIANMLKNYLLHSEKYNNCGINGRRFFCKEFKLETYIVRLMAIFYNQFAK